MLYLKHGGHVLADNAAGASQAVRVMDDAVLATRAFAPGEDAALALGEDRKQPEGTPFDYLLPELKGKLGSHLQGDLAKVVADLKALGAAVVDNASLVDQDPAVSVLR